MMKKVQRGIIMLISVVVLVSFLFLVNFETDDVFVKELSIAKQKELKVVIHGSSSHYIEIPENIKKEIAKKTAELVFVFEDGASLIGGAIIDEFPFVNVEEGASTELDLDGDGIVDVIVTINYIYESGRIDASFSVLGAEINKVDEEFSEVVEEASRVIAHWKFDRDAFDSKGNADGILRNGALILDNELALDGKNDYVEIPDNEVLNSIKDEVSISAWISPPKKLGVIFDGYKNHGNSDGFGMWTNVADDKLFASFAAFKGRDPQVWTQIEATTDMIHLVGVYDGSSRKIYVNGELKNSNSASGTFSDSGFSRRIGGQVKSHDRSKRFFDGNIEDVKIWNYALSDTEIKNEYGSNSDETIGVEALSVSLPIETTKLEKAGSEIEKIFDEKNNVLKIIGLPDGLGDHTITYLGYDEDTKKYQFLIETDPQTIGVAEGETEGANLDDEDDDDISLTVSSVSGDKITVKVTVLGDPEETKIPAFSLSEVGDSIPVVFTSEVLVVRIIDLPNNLGDHKITFHDLNTEVNEIIFLIESEKQLVPILVGDTRDVDLNGDDVDDISISVDDFSGSSLSTTIKLLKQEQRKLSLPEGVSDLCFDSDGGFELFSKGKLMVIKDDVVDEALYEDSCEDGKLKEFLCRGTVPFSRTFPVVPQGYKCEDGEYVSEEAVCEDSDDGDIYTKGILKVGGLPGAVKAGEDYCNGRNTLVEQSCKDGKSGSIYYSCACDDGACTEEVEVSSCYDPDSADELYDKTSLIIVVDGERQPSLEFEDSCTSDGRLKEANCFDSRPNIKIRDCDTGESCVEGVCVSAPICEDSDNEDPFTFGVVEYGATNNIKTEFDRCAGDDRLEEQICSNGRVGKMIISCDCVRGACVKEGEETGDFSCIDSDEKNYENKGFVEYTDFSGTLKMEDVCPNPDSLQEFTCTKNGLGSVSTSCQCQDGACVGERYRCEDLFGFDIHNKNELKVSIGKEEVSDYVDGCTPDGKLKEAFCGKRRPEFQEISCPEGETCKEGACVEKLKGVSINELKDRLQSQSTQVQSSGGGGALPAWILKHQQLLGVPQGIFLGPYPDPNILCEDDDGENYEKKAEVISKGQTYKDVCNSDNLGGVLDTDYTADAVVEKICQNDELRILFKECDGECVDGECVEKITCEDSDDNDYYNKGKITYENHPSILESYDSCADSKTVIERVCKSQSNNGVNYERFDCPNGCEAGECVAPCKESPDNNINTQGSVTVTSAGSKIIYEDKCEGPIAVKENSCVEGVRKVESLPCGSGFSCMAGACVKLEVPECKDTDNEEAGFEDKDVFEKGTIITKRSFRADKCEGTHTLLEGVCGEPDNLREIECEFGCVTGACLESVECTEDDDGDDPSQFGVSTLKWNGKQQAQGQDSCTDNSTLREFYCEDNRVKNRFHNCESDEKCDAGVCVPINPFICSDNDGKNKNLQGTSNGEQETCILEGALFSDDQEVESCEADNCAVREYWCALGFGWSQNIRCEFGCSQGACLPALKAHQLECMETDGGRLDYTASGGAFFERESLFDKCVTDKRLKESYCAENEIKYSYVDCIFGCEYGACLYSDPELGYCEDSDGGTNIYASGTTSQEGFQTKEDYCRNENILIETTCDYSEEGNQIRETSIHCTCLNGACLPDPENDKCVDDDAGKEYFIKGVAKHSSGQSIPDSCDSDNILREAICVSSGTGTSYLTSFPVDCLYGCTEGKCRIEPKKPFEIISAKVIPEKGTKDTIFNLEIEINSDVPVSRMEAETYFVKRFVHRSNPGDDGGTIDVKKGDNIYTSVIAVGDSTGEHSVNLNVELEGLPREALKGIVSFEVFEPESCFDTDEGKNIFVKGNADLKGATGKRDTCYKSEGDANFVADNRCVGDNCYVEEAFCDANYFAPQTEKIKCPGNCVGGACISEELKCEETDKGFDPLNEGVVTYTGGEFRDSCLDENTLSEGYCDVRSNLVVQSRDCEFGCFEGRCLSQFLACADDLDGRDNFVKGGVNGEPEYCGITSDLGTIRKESCEGEDCHLWETWCDSKEGRKYEKVSCDIGCFDGACVKEGAEFCKDPDANYKKPHPAIFSVFINADAEAKTIAKIMTGNLVVQELEDKCFDDVSISEAICDNNELKYRTPPILCDSEDVCLDGACVDAACVDSDEGNSPELGGNVTKGRRVVVDTCNEKEIKEYYCENNEIKEETHPCEFGCYEGVCLDSPPTCVDSDLEDGFADSEALILTAGFEIDRLEDNCFEDGFRLNSSGQEVPIEKVNEAVCVNNELTYKPILCDDGCVLGRCKKPIALSAASCWSILDDPEGLKMGLGTCKDEDGEDIYTVSLSRARPTVGLYSSHYIEDGCAVYESDEADGEDIESDNDYVYPVSSGDSCGGPLTYNEDLYSSNYKGRNSCYGDNCYVKEAGCADFGDIQGVDYKYIKCPEGNSCFHGRCVDERVENPGSTFLVYPDECETKIGPSGPIYECDELTSLDVSCPEGTVLTDTTLQVIGGSEYGKTEKIKQYSKTIKGNVATWTFEIKSNTNYVPSLEIELRAECRNGEGISCYDSEPEDDIFVAGNVTIKRHGEVIRVDKDECVQGGIQKTFCDDENNAQYITEICPEDSICLGGKCILNDEFCSDTDGGEDYFVRGEVSGTLVTKSSDTCAEINLVTGQTIANVQRCIGPFCRLKELSCGEIHQDVLSGLISCDQGCYNGACVLKTTKGTINYKTVVRSAKIDYAQMCGSDRCEQRISRSLECPLDFVLESSSEDIKFTEGFKAPQKTQFLEGVLWSYVSEPQSLFKLVSDQTITCQNKQILSFIESESGVVHDVLSSEIDLLPYLNKETEFVFNGIHEGVVGTGVHVKDVTTAGVQVGSD
jgi:hypothetical protein